MTTRFPLFGLAQTISLAIGLALPAVAFAADPEPRQPEPMPVRVENTDAMMKILDSIKIKEINFQNADINAVIDFLVDESRRMNPDGGGPNIEVREVPAGRTIRSLRLRDIKLIDVIKVITDLANMRYVVEAGRVVIVPVDSLYGLKMETRSYPIDPSLILRMMPKEIPVPPPPPLDPLGGGGVIVPRGEVGKVEDGGAVYIDSALLVTFLEHGGAPFPRGANAQFLPAFGRLVVTNTVQNLEILERLLEDLSVGQYQLSIESRVLRLPRKMARDVFKEQLDARGAVAISDETLRTLDRLDTEMKLFTVCRPRVTTVFGQKATTKSMRQILYVTHYKLEDGKPMPQMGNCEVGTEMTVKPVLSTDGHAINLSLELKISSFIEMRKTNAMLPGFDKPVPMETPELAVRNVSTNLTLQRDTTVMLPLLDDAPEPNVKKDFVEVVLINASINWPRLAKPQKAP